MFSYSIWKLSWILKDFKLLKAEGEMRGWGAVNEESIFFEDAGQ